MNKIRNETKSELLKLTTLNCEFDTISANEQSVNVMN